MLRQHEHTGLTWVNLENPSREEAIRVMEKFGILPSVVETFLAETHYSKLESFGSYQFAVLHFPVHARKSGLRQQEIDFVLGKDFLITSHKGPVSALFEVEKTVDVMPGLEEVTIDEKPGILFLYIIERMYHLTSDELEEIAGSLVRIEEGIFSGKREDRLIQALSHLNRRIIDMRRALRFHEPILRKIESLAPRTHLVSLTRTKHTREEYNRIITEMENQSDILMDLRSTADLLSKTRGDTAMRLISIILFVTVPFSITLDIVRAEILPFVVTPEMAVVLLLASAAVGIILLAIFRYIKWI